MSRKDNPLRGRRDRHHVTPRSRGGGNRHNLVRLPVTFHRALHAVFQDLKPEEYATFLEEVLVPGKSWTSKELHALRARCKHYNR
jgi:hypothetical protein